MSVSVELKNVAKEGDDRTLKGDGISKGKFSDLANCL